ncbi:hypothetical protein R1sor_026227 [Riccia sorocarpa]|uniref:Uncharacterized protein n=1 Tax=Riccia sorocarpa TaxID=122646 RepID=A0ABD3GGG8_9MARC
MWLPLQLRKQCPCQLNGTCCEKYCGSGFLSPKYLVEAYFDETYAFFETEWTSVLKLQCAKIASVVATVPHVNVAVGSARALLLAGNVILMYAAIVGEVWRREIGLSSTAGREGTLYVP